MLGLCRDDPFNGNDTMNAMTDTLSGRIILISGAYGGIGRVLSKGFAARGATVILLGRNIRTLTELYDEIEAAGYPIPAIYPMDLATATTQDFQTLEETLEKNFGRLDGLIHNAALLGSLTPLEYYPLEQWHQVMQVNVHSAFLLSQATLPLLKRSDQATIIFSNTAENATILANPAIERVIRSMSSSGQSRPP